MTPARDTILGALRDGLRDAAVPPLPEPAAPRELAVAERRERFAAVLGRAGGHVDVVPDLAAAHARVSALLAEHGCRSVLLSDAPVLAGLAAALPASLRTLPPDALRDDQLAADAGVTSAQWGIAETGTLVLESAAEHHRLASLLPALHVAVLPASRLLGTLADVFARLQRPGGAPSARTITFVTGPSRTADIELTLVVGVHGPKRLHVLVVADR